MANRRLFLPDLLGSIGSLHGHDQMIKTNLYLIIDFNLPLNKKSKNSRKMWTNIIRKLSYNFQLIPLVVHSFDTIFRACIAIIYKTTDHLLLKLERNTSGFEDLLIIYCLPTYIRQTPSTNKA
ncbi:hypothetical protein BpHYR1_029644 [Brachionus plicatilis]|uniref:Uncharacterized protein n=1 Tax=Brachionus plicatilis TaxID=10195 RepID=A0A3M7QCY1_BRAPC|nr:hypothetical protein BpHYR1_029644 [Brachionus plicatilis]